MLSSSKTLPTPMHFPELHLDPRMQHQIPQHTEPIVRRVSNSGSSRRWVACLADSNLDKDVRSLKKAVKLVYEPSGLVQPILVVLQHVLTPTQNWPPAQHTVAGSWQQSYGWALSIDPVWEAGPLTGLLCGQQGIWSVTGHVRVYPGLQES